MPKMRKNIRKRKDGRYEGRYADGYKPDGSIKYHSVYGKTYEEARKKCDEAAGGRYNLEKNTGGRLLVSQITSMWLQSKKPYIKQSTYFRYLSVTEKHIDSFFGSKPVTEITDAMIQRICAELMCSLKPKTVRDILTVLKQILGYAAEQGLCTEPPVKIQLPKDAPRMMKILSPTEQQRLSLYLKSEPDLQKMGVLLCLYTGMRLGEICGLRWEDIDFMNQMIKIRRTIQRIGKGNDGTRFLLDTPKTQKSIRDIPVPDFLMEYLKEYRCADTAAYVLTGTVQFVQPRTYQNRFKAYLKESGLPEDFHFHTLRHTFASRAIELGFDPKSLSEILGHASVNITLDRYVHSSIELKRRNMELFSTVI